MVWKSLVFGVYSRIASKHVCVSAIDWDNLFCSAEELLTVGILLVCFYGHLE